MSGRPIDHPGDRRRRRGPAAGPTASDPDRVRGRSSGRTRSSLTSPRGASGEATPSTGAAGENLAGQADGVVLSRTLFSLLQPSLRGVVAFAAPLTIAGIIGLVSGIVVSAFVSSMKVYGYVNIAIGGGVLGLVALASLSSVLAAFLSRTGRYGINSLILMLAFTGIIVVANIISFENNSRMDLTATNQFSLNSSTKRLLKDLDEPVRATAFYKDDLDDPNVVVRRVRVEETFKEFSAARPSKFRFRFVDPDLEPDIKSGYFGSTPTPFINETVVVEGMNSGITHPLQPTDGTYSQLEQYLYTSILVVSGREKKTIYFLAGHGEHDINSAGFSQRSDPAGYDNVRAGLVGDNYDVRTLSWDRIDEDTAVPDEPAQGCSPSRDECLPAAALVVIAGPTEELPEAHAQALDLYLRGKKKDSGGAVVDRREGGRLAFLAEPNTPDSFREFLAHWGVIVGDGYIRDEGRSFPGLPRTLQLEAISVFDLPEETTRNVPRAILDTLVGITTPVGKSLGIIRLPGAAPLGVVEDPNRLAVPLAFTSPGSYLIADIERTEPIKDAGDKSDPRGPFTPVAYIEAVAPVGEPPPTPGSPPAENQIARMVVFGDSDFIANENFSLGSGADLFLNSVNHLLGDYSLISIRPKAFAFREFYLDRNEHNFVRFSSWLFLPGALGLMAALVWWVRR